MSKKANAIEEQLRDTRIFNNQLMLQIKSLNETIIVLKNTIESLEQALKSKNESLVAQKDATKRVAKLISTKSEKKKEPLDDTAFKEKQELKKKKIEDRKNNGAKRNAHEYKFEVEERHIYPDDPIFDKLTAKEIGVRMSVRYSVIPMNIIKTVYYIHSYKQGENIYSGKIKQAPLLNSNYDGSFIAMMAQLRYIYSMPVERIVKYINENGFEMNKATANGLLSKIASVLDNLHKSLKATVLEDNYLSCDETYHKVMFTAKKENQRNIMKGYIWGLVGMTNKLVYYCYDNGSRAKKVIDDLLGNYTDTIQCDGYAPYKSINDNLTRLSCLQHCKRKFLDMSNNPEADKITQLINKLYHQEHKHRIGIDGWSEEDNLKWRKKYSVPIMTKLKASLESIKRSKHYPPKSQMYLAAQYVLNEFSALENIFTSGRYELDNNTIERINRYISLSRRNSLFFGSHKGAERGVVFYSLACSCRLHNINFFDYISDVINKVALIPATTPISEYRDLLPDKWSK